MNKIQQNILATQISIAYGESISLRKIIKITEPSIEKDNLVGNLIQKQKHFRALKHSFELQFPDDYAKMNTELRLVQAYIEVQNTDLNQIIKKIKLSLRTVDFAITRFNFSRELNEGDINQRAFAQIIDKNAPKIMIHQIKMLDTKNYKSENLLLICDVMTNTLNSFDAEQLAVDYINDTKMLVKLDIFKRNAKKLRNSIIEIIPQLSELEMIQKNIGLPTIKAISLPEPEVCSSCNGERFVKGYIYGNDGNFEDCIEPSCTEIYEKCSKCNP